MPTLSTGRPVILAILQGALALAAVALLNGGPIMFPDTLYYLGDGQGLVRLTAPNNIRPVFYGFAIEFLHWERSSWPVIAAQALIVAHIVYLTMRCIVGVVRPTTLFHLLAGLALLTPVAWYVAHLLPDLFSGVLIPAFFLLGFCRDRLGRWETGYLFLLTTAAISFHLANVVTGAALCLGLVLSAWRLRVGRPLLPCLAYGGAIALLLGSSFVLYHRVTLTPKSPPALMARLIADGPGRDFLVATCPQRRLRICDDLARVPDTENGILWGYLATLDSASAQQVRAEAGIIERGTMAMFPVQVFLHMMLNTARQFIDVSSGMEMDTFWWSHFDEPAFLVREVRGTLQQRGLLEHVLPVFNVLHAAVAIVSAFVCVRLVRRHRREDIGLLVGTTVLALAANAFASGALAGTFGRYQGRMIWMLPAAAAIGLIAERRAALRADPAGTR